MNNKTSKLFKGNLFVLSLLVGSVFLLLLFICVGTLSALGGIIVLPWAVRLVSRKYCLLCSRMTQD
jgi:small neutral amino acid transporter SnatA (MarC family)